MDRMQISGLVADVLVGDPAEIMQRLNMQGYQ